MKKVSNVLKIGLSMALMAVGVFGIGLPVSAETVKCPAGTPPAQCAQMGIGGAMPEGSENDLTQTIQDIINVVIMVIGIIAVVMVILGGIKYSTSQGAADKVKSAKDTIMYGIIGLVVAILAFAIVNFVMDGVFGA